MGGWRLQVEMTGAPPTLPRLQPSTLWSPGRCTAGGAVSSQPDHAGGGGTRLREPPEASVRVRAAAGSDDVCPAESKGGQERRGCCWGRGARPLPPAPRGVTYVQPLPSSSVCVTFLFPPCSSASPRGDRVTGREVIRHHRAHPPRPRSVACPSVCVWQFWASPRPPSLPPLICRASWGGRQGCEGPGRCLGRRGRCVLSLNGREMA